MITSSNKVVAEMPGIIDKVECLIILKCDRDKREARVG